MKAVMISLFLANVLSASASAAPVNKWVCTGQGNYLLKVTVVGPAGQYNSSARLTVPGERGARKMRCLMPLTSPVVVGVPDGTRLVLTCDDQKRAGYRADLTSGGFAGLNLAHVFAKNSTQDDLKATLSCKRADPGPNQ